MGHRIWTRRSFSGEALRAFAALAISRSIAHGLAEVGSVPSLRFSKESPVAIPPDFIGLGYETSSVATPGLLSPDNHNYVELVRGLGRHGVVRVGGIVADYSSYSAEGPAAHDRQNTVITQACLEQFGAFLKATGWKTIWSVNFAQGTVQQALKEARAVSEVLGSQLLALEIGNEVENYGKGNAFRAQPYSYEDYRREFDEWHSALAAAIPEVSFAGPDTAQSLEWVERMAKDANGALALLTTHYYRNGQRRGTAEQLLSSDPRLREVLQRMRAASQSSGIPWRLCEMNSFSGGGLPGVSDTFIGALWTLNILLLLAAKGCAGVNVETGVNQLGFVSSYSPIQDDGRGANSAGVPYYGMLAFKAAFSGCNQILPLEPSNLDERISAYALGAAGKPRSLVVVNMSTVDAVFSVESFGFKHASVLRLTAPSPDSKSGVKFGNSAVDSTGRWSNRSREILKEKTIHVSRMSAAIFLARN
jgi:hypothetical protein